MNKSVIKMAFVHRSSREIKSVKNDDSIGPGKYYSPNSWEKRKQSAAPFNTSGSRHKLFDNNNIPGPGAYHPVIVSTLTKSKKELPYLYAETTNDNVFISCQKRFKDEHNANIPGPGEYNLTTNSPRRKEKERYLFERNKPKNSSMSKERILSIPSKDKSFGYQVSSSGLVSLANDPDQNIKYTGEKSDSIAPNQYDIKEPFKRNNIIDWKRSEQYSKENKEMSSLLPTNISNGSVMKGSECVTSFEKNKVKSKKPPAIFRNNCLGLKVNEEKSEIDFELFGDKNDKKNSIPGPGSYSPYNYIDSKKYIPLPINLQYFGSSLTRSAAIKTATNETGVGPGEYFKQESYIKRPISKINAILRNAPHSQRGGDKFTKIKQEREQSLNQLGPGAYEIAKPSFINHKSASSLESFGTLEKRFLDYSSSEKNNCPGAGSYLNLNTWVNPSQIHIHKPHPTDIRTVEKDRRPGVGEYHPELFCSIEFNLQNKKYSKVQIAPFESNSKRFPNKPHMNANLGPGTYELRDVNVNSNTIDVRSKRLRHPFISQEKRSNIYNSKLNESNKLGPGKYISNSYFEWNKKSFNVLFS